MFKYLGIFAMALMLAACHGNAGSSDPLVGTYGVEGRDAVHPLLKIERAGDRYLAYDRDKDGRWEPLREQISPFTAADLSAVSGRSEPDDVTGIKANTFVFFKVPVGWSVPGFRTRTGYVVFVALKLVDLKRMP